MTISMTLRLEEDLACRVRLVARLEGVSQAEIARRSLRRYTSYELRDGDADERLERLHQAERRRLGLSDAGGGDDRAQHRPNRFSP